MTSTATARARCLRAGTCHSSFRATDVALWLVTSWAVRTRLAREAAAFHAGWVSTVPTAAAARTPSVPSLDDRAGLDEHDLRALQDLLAAQTTLEDVVRGALRDEPPRLIAEVVTQDEYTHDVVVPWRAHYLVYDTT